MYQYFSNTARRVFAALAFVFIISTFVIAFPNVAKAASRIEVSIVGGTVTVDTMSSIPESRIRWLVQIADRSSCTTNPIINNCDGFMSPGDRVVVGDNYMAFMDLTRENNYGSGGGGVLRGVWMLVNDITGNRNFKYISNSSNQAPNNLFPGSAVGSGDAHELLVLPQGSQDPAGTFRATSSSSVNIFTDGVYTSSPDPNLSYHFHGVLTKGDGQGNAYSENIGTASNPAKMYYHLYYWFYNNYYSVGNSKNAFAIQTRASMDVCGSQGCNQTVPLTTAVYTLGVSHFNAYNKIRTNYFKPVSHNLISGDYTQSCNQPAAFYTGSLYSLSGGGIIAQVNTQSPFSIKYKVDNDPTLSNFRVNISNSTVQSFGVNINSKVFQQMIYNTALNAIVYDSKVGNTNQCGGALGVMLQNQWVQWDYNISLEYESP